MNVTPIPLKKRMGLELFSRLKEAVVEPLDKKILITQNKP